MGTRARRRDIDSARRVRALTRRAYLATAGHLDLDDDEPPPNPRADGFEEILHGPPDQRRPAERARERARVRWRVTLRSVIAAVLVLGALTGIVVIRSMAVGGRAAVPLPPAVQPDPAIEAPDGAGSDPPAVASPTDGAPAADVSPAPWGPTEPAGSPAASSEPGAAGGELVVHVAGAVHTPGIVTVPAGARVADVVDRAGGPTSTAELGAINLARAVVDGEQVYVPEVGQAEPGAQAGPAPGALPGAGGPATAAQDAPVDLNTADQAGLETLPGVGPSIAQRILDWRQTNGSFHTVEELLEVPGIGPATLERLRPRVTV